MLDALLHLAIFFLQTFIVVVAILIITAGIVALLSKTKSKPQLSIRKINQFYEKMAEAIQEEILSKKERKKLAKEKKQALKNKDQMPVSKKRIFVINFDGDLKAKNVDTLREEISAILMVAKTTDEIVLRLESSGGVVHGYGLAASQLQRIKNNAIPLTIAVDKIAASGGYMMACVADRLLAAPFAIIGSIGVLAQLPNFHRVLKKNDIEFEQITAGEYKRTLSLFGENTRDGRKKFQEEINEAHELFKSFVKQHRPQVEIDAIATGEYWFAKKAKELNMVDELNTSDAYLLNAAKQHDIYEIKYKKKKSPLDRLSLFTQSSIQTVLNNLKKTSNDSTYL
ncbi:MAG: protease SohB [Gammaproteobacteria bacterium]|nr:protease SohB [Gammaproteobacteria bacterium]